MAIALVVSCAALYCTYIAVALQLHGVHAQGRVIAVEVYYRRGSSSGVHYQPEISYSDIHGRTNTFTSHFSSFCGLTYQVGDPVDVVYLPNGAPHAIIDSTLYQWFLPLVLFLFSLVFYLIPALWIPKWYRHRNLAYWLEANGQTITAQVSGTENKKIVAKWQDPVRGTTYIFKSPDLVYDPTPFLKETIMVRIDPRDPNRYIMDLSFLPDAA